MTLFPSWFLAVLVHGGIALAAIGGMVLVALLLRDARRRQLW